MEQPARATTWREKITGRAMPVVLLTIFIDVMGVAILIPVLPQLVYNIFMPSGYTLGGALIILGWLTGIYPLMQFLATPVLGQLSDRYGRKPVLALSLLGTAIGYVVFALGVIFHHIPLLFVGRILDGLTGGNVSVARAVIADVTDPKHRARNFGLIGACFGVGFVLGPYIGARLAVPHANLYGLFSTPGWFSSATPFWFATALSVLNVVLVLLVLPETHKHIDRQLRLTWSKALTNIGHALNHPTLRVLYVAEFLFWGGFTFFMTFFQILLIEKLGFKIGNVGDFFAYVGIWVIASQVLLVPLVGKYSQSHRILQLSFLGTGLALILQLVPHNTAQLLLTAPFIAAFFGLTMANASALVSLSATKRNQGEVLGIEASVQALAQSFPGVIAGYVASLGVATPVWVGGLLIVLGGLVFIVWYRVPRAVEAKEEPGVVPVEVI